jgi:alkylation response protein AidB-like acyl-CoA dehydrogenase
LIDLEKLVGGTLGEAARGGAAARSVGEAFLAGYGTALRRLVPALPAQRRVCLCATEEGGAHPRNIKTTLADGKLSGYKKWATGGPLADLLLVVASTGIGDDGRNRLKLALVDAHGPGVTLTPMPPTPFVPEIPHAEVRLDGAPALEVLEGDGYERYLKPFRTIEDAHVFGAVLGYLFAAAQQNTWPRAFSERVLAVLASLARVADGDPGSRELHLILAGALQLGRQLANEAAGYMDEPTRAIWQRDCALLDVAGKARQARSDAAWGSA